MQCLCEVKVKIFTLLFQLFKLKQFILNMWESIFLLILMVETVLLIGFKKNFFFEISKYSFCYWPFVRLILCNRRT